MTNLFEKTELYQIPDSEAKRPADPRNNKKNTLVLVTPEDLSAERHLLLHNILKAVDISQPETIEIVDVSADTHMHLHPYLSSGQYVYVFIFGLTLDQLSLHIPDRRPTIWSFDACQIVLAPALESLADSRAQKQALWKMLKGTFKNT